VLKRITGKMAADPPLRG